METRFFRRDTRCLLLSSETFNKFRCVFFCVRWVLSQLRGELLINRILGRSIYLFEIKSRFYPFFDSVRRSYRRSCRRRLNL